MENSNLNTLNAKMKMFYCNYLKENKHNISGIFKYKMDSYSMTQEQSKSLDEGNN